MTAAVEGRYGVVRQRRQADTTLATDTFTESTNMPLQNHTPDSGGGSWVTSTTDAWLLEGTSGATSVNIASRVWARWGTGLADDAFTLQGEITRGPADGTAQEGGLWGLAAGSVGEGAAFLWRRTGAGITSHFLERRNSTGGVVQTATLGTNLPPSVGEMLTMRLTVDGLDVTCEYLTTDAGSTWTTHTAVTLTDDLRDGNHTFMGIMGSRNGVSTRTFVDDLTATRNYADVGEVREWRIAAHQEVVETSSTDARLIIPGERSWQATAQALHLGADFSQTEIRDGVIVPRSLSFQFYPTTDSTGYIWSGDGYVSDFAFGGDTQGAMLANVVIDGDGPLTEGS